MASEAATLYAQGVQVTLGDKSYPLIFDFEALCLLEEEMGGLEVFAQRLTDRKWRLRTVRAGMVATLAHSGLTRAEILSFLKYKNANVYLDAMKQAFVRDVIGEPQESEDPKVEGSPNGSPGDATTTSLPSPSVAAMASSGA